MKAVSNTEVVTVKFQKKNLRNQAHRYFDKLWEFKYATRDETYQHLAKFLGVAEPFAHMSQADDEQCKSVIEWAIMMLNDMRRLDLDFGANIKHPYYELITNNKK